MTQNDTACVRSKMMTDKQFWMKADQISDSGKTAEEKAEAMAALLKTAYDSDLKMVILTRGNYQVYLNLDENHPNTIGNRGFLCYTSKRKSQEDAFAPFHDLDWGYAPVRDVLNNLFCKAAAGHLIFNCYAIEKTIAVSKETLEKYIPGPHPAPEGFVDVPVSGYPMIPKIAGNR